MTVDVKPTDGKNYIENSYEGEDETNLIESENKVQDDRGDSILRSEFEKAMKELKKNKAPSVGLKPVELLQNLRKEVENEIYKLTNEMYESGDIPNNFKRSSIVTILKKVGADKCENYRTISLTSHASKILTKIICRRLEQEVEESIREDQFGFRKRRGYTIF